MRLVLDTNTVVSGLLWTGAPRLLIDAAQERKVSLFTSAPLLRELANVLGRGKFDKKVAAFQLTPEQVIQRYIELVISVMPNPVPRTVVDADDDVVLGTAKRRRQTTSFPETTTCCGSKASKSFLSFGQLLL